MTNQKTGRGWRLGALTGGALLAGGLASGLATPAFAEVSEETAYVFNTLLFLIGGFLVMLMALGFTLLEVGFVRQKHSGVICAKNIGLYSIAGIMFYLVGYQILYAGYDSDSAGWIISQVLAVPSIWGPGELASDEAIDVTANGYATASDWFFQMVFVATAASIVSGTLAERVRILPFFIFVAVLTAFIYPIQASWQWGTGWLYDLGFSDFAGSTLVHSTGGWAALAGAILLGARTGRFGPNRVAMSGHSLPLATAGTFILWFGWFGFNGASQLALGSADNATAVAQIFANTNMAAAGGVVASYICALIIGKGKVNLSFLLNGALGGLVAITAEPLTPTILEAILIGAAGGIIATFGSIFLEMVKIDDVVGAIPVHLFAGIFGTLIVPATNSEISILHQIIGVVSIGAFVFIVSFVIWLILKMTVGIRLSEEAEIVGGDMSELGHDSYPDFVEGND